MRPTARSRRCSSGCVAAASKGKQTSWEHTSLSGEFYSSLSLGNLIDEYNDTALADRLFVIDPAKKSHRIIAGLKSCDWYKQNPALELLSQDSVQKMSKNSLFVVGRNIYRRLAAMRAELRNSCISS
jgi:hypothetical protein